MKSYEKTINIEGKERKLYFDYDAAQGKHGCCIVIGHGASGDASSGNLPRIAQILAKEGHQVVRYNASGQLPARCKLLQALLATLASSNDEGEAASSFILSGHSMGGRTACAVARQRDGVKGVLLFSYPLHPPGKPEQLRDEDLTALEQPVMIVRGSKDAFSTDGPFSEVSKRMDTKTLRVVDVPGGDHSLGTKTAAGEKRFVEWIEEVKAFVEEVTSNGGGKAASTPAEKPRTAKGPAAKRKAGATAKDGKKITEEASESASKSDGRKGGKARGTPAKGQGGVKKAKGGAKGAGQEVGGKKASANKRAAGLKAAEPSEAEAGAGQRKGSKRQKRA